MRQKFVTVVAVASLVLCVAATALWVRSYFFGDKLSLRWAIPSEIRSATLLAYTNKGTIYVSRYDVGFGGAVPPRFVEAGPAHLSWESYRAYHLGDIAAGPVGFGATDSSRAKALSEPPGVQQVERWRIVAAPMWAPVLLLCLPPVLWLRRVRRCRRATWRESRGLCVACGYDLRASFDRCPECGAVAQPPPAAAAA